MRIHRNGHLVVIIIALLLNTACGALWGGTNAGTNAEPGQTAPAEGTQNPNPGGDDNNRAPTQSPESAAAEKDEIARQNARIDKLEQFRDGQSFLTSPVFIGGLAALTLLGLGLNGLGLFLFARTRDNLEKLRGGVSKLAAATKASSAAQQPAPFAAPAPAQAASSADVSSALDGVSQQIRQQKQSIDLLTNRIGQLENRATAGEQRTVESLQAVEQVTKWLERMHMRGAAVDGFADESDPASSVPALERDLERLRANAGAAEPLSQAVADLVERLEARPSAPPELLNRVQKLYHDVGQFDQWALAVETHLGALRRGSIDERRVEFKNQQRQLTQQFQSKQINFAQYIEQFSRMLEQHFPPGSGNGRAAQTQPAPRREQFARYAEGAPEYLMDWFSNFSQLQSQAQAAQATGAGVDSETLTELARVQAVAREVLNRFDIQPEEIMVGRTSYDRHLHDAAMVRQSTQFPTNTIIEVHSAGFRRVSTGEVLRRPQVIVAGSAA